MALLLLITVGLSAGWFASIAGRTDAPRDILRQMGLGLIASLIAGLLMNSGTVMGGLSLIALAVAIAASAVILVAYHAIFQRTAEI